MSSISAFLMASLAMLAIIPGEALAEATDWNTVLERHWVDGGLDYEALAANREPLDAYLATLPGTDVASWSAPRQLAFWINAYNAVVTQFVLERYPAISSVKEVDGFFDGLIHEVAGERLTLDEIEGRARAFDDPRVHFAVVCASTSCPDLRAEAFEADRIEAQLQEQTERFLADTEKGLRFDPRAGKLYLSSIFKWYAGDFTGGSTVVAFFARGKVTDWVVLNLPDDLAERIRDADPSVAYLDYDWSLNDR